MNNLGLQLHISLSLFHSESDFIIHCCDSKVWCFIYQDFFILKSKLLHCRFTYRGSLFWVWGASVNCELCWPSNHDTFYPGSWLTGWPRTDFWNTTVQSMAVDEWINGSIKPPWKVSSMALSNPPPHAPHRKRQNAPCAPASWFQQFHHFQCSKVMKRIIGTLCFLLLQSFCYNWLIVVRLLSACVGIFA